MDIKVAYTNDQRAKPVFFGITILSIPILVATLFVGMSIYVFEVVDAFQNDFDMCWIEDNTTTFIMKHKRLPESWEELWLYNIYRHNESVGIESRVEVNFDFLKGINTGKLNGTVLPPKWSDARKEIWVYRLHRFPKAINQEQVMADFFYRLAVSRTLSQNDDSHLLGGDNPENGKTEYSLETD